MTNVSETLPASAKQLERAGGRLWRRMRTTLGAVLGVTALVALGGTGCSLDSLLDSDKLPPDVTDPAITRTPEGAQAAYIGTLAKFRDVFGGSGRRESFIPMTGLITDELRWSRNEGNIDRRFLPEGSATPPANTYGSLQKIRGQAAQAIGLLTTYLSDQPALAGHLYALQGYAEVFLAELFCSGIPLSTLDFDGDFTYQPGSTTRDVFTHAVALFDTALALASDSTRFVHLAQVGKARALLALGEYSSAATAVAAVSDGYRYEVRYSNLPGTRVASNFADQDDIGSIPWLFTVPDREGNNGLDWLTSQDPRTPLVLLPSSNIHYPSNYDPLGGSALVLASAVEARLIEAEAALQAGGPDWLVKLNALRTDGTFETHPTPDLNDDPTALDTLWHAGSGGVDSLAPLADPGTAKGRVDLVFRERAFWLFLTGHRQGDLRRLIRHYGPQFPNEYTQDKVYPVGPYPGLGVTSYGSDVTAPIPSEEFANPLFTGCASRGA